MSEIVITYAGSMPQHPGQPMAADIHPYVPCFQATRGSDLIFKVWVQLSGYAGTIAKTRLEHDGVEDPDSVLNGLLLRYAVRRLEAQLRDLGSSGAVPDPDAGLWELGIDDVPELLALDGEKSCDYQRRSRRDLFCLTPSRGDATAVYEIGGRSAAPTSRSVCSECDLPDTDYLCSNLLHPEIGSVTALGGMYRRQVVGAICDLGKQEVASTHECHAGGNSCWQRIVELEPPVVEPISPLTLAESFDVLDALWRLAFGRNKRLLALSTATGSVALALGCVNRAEFEARLSALADIVDRLKVDPTLLPPNLPPDDIKGSLDALEKCLLHQLPVARHPAVAGAIQTMRRVRQARNAVQHGITEGGGLTAKLHELGVHDAPPNWSGAWDSIRVQTANALTVIRNELRQWVDSTP